MNKAQDELYERFMAVYNTTACTDDEVVDILRKFLNDLERG